MTDYPDSIYNPREKENASGVTYDPTKKTVGYAEDITKLDDEIKATQTELGTNPKGAYATVKAWLQALADAITGKAASPGGATEIAHILGKDETIKRIRNAVSLLENNERIV